MFCSSMDFSGVSISSDPSCGDWNLTPSCTSDGPLSLRHQKMVFIPLARKARCEMNHLTQPASSTIQTSYGYQCNNAVPSLRKDR
jgi:hypothetical protein